MARQLWPTSWHHSWLRSDRDRTSTSNRLLAAPGAAVRLLYEEYVDRIILNDLHPGVAAFWRAVVDHTDQLVERIRTCELSIDSWHQYRATYISRPRSDVELGFATLYLNRTNRSGILDARPIGGLQQSGQWKLGVRFNRESLAERVQLLGAYRDRITVHERDALDLLSELDTRDAFIYIDPPYLTQSEDLYLNTLTWQDHQRLAKLLTSRHRRWVLTYDVDPRIREVLYPHLRCAEFTIKHTAARQHMGSEYAVFPKSLTLDDISSLGNGDARWVSNVENG